MGLPEKLTSRDIPFPIQREIRQRCGFGCVICGMPLYEYEHMLGWANVHRHVADEITLLCDQHERERTNNLLPLEVVMEANQNPHNWKTGVSKPYDLFFYGNECEIIIGGNRFTAVDHGYGTAVVPISVDGGPLIGFIIGDRHLLLNIAVFDEFNKLVLQIKNNQLFYSINPWDIQLVGTTLKIREMQKRILIEIVFNPPNKVIINRGRFLRNGIEILIRPTNILITNDSTLLSHCEFENCHTFLGIGPHDNNFQGGTAIRLENVPRYLGDRREALRFEKECMQFFPSLQNTGETPDLRVQSPS
jgi:hypothetical protein